MYSNSYFLEYFYGGTQSFWYENFETYKFKKSEESVR